jgi:hypothetical protein
VFGGGGGGDELVDVADAGGVAAVSLVSACAKSLCFGVYFTADCAL